MNSPYTGPPHPSTDALTNRRYTTARSRIVDAWIAYADLELLLIPEKREPTKPPPPRAR